MKKIAIANVSGGRGKTWVANMLADVLTDRHDKSVLIVDLDPLGGMSFHFLSRGPIVSSTETILAALIDPQVMPHAVSHRLSLFVGNDTLNQADSWLAQQLNPDGVLRAFFQTWNHALQYDYCLIDCGPGLSGLTRDALVAADRVVVPQWVSRSINPDIAETNVAITVQEAQRIRAKQALSSENVSITIVKPLDAFSDEDWYTLTARVMA
jgi:chromosome partitioning protein